MRGFFLYIFLFYGLILSAQKYNFVNYSVEDGLIQSQALHICQDKYRQLWISTEGGISKFDGKKFTGYSIQDGLSSNRIGDVMCDKDGNIWSGTEFGLSVFNGKKFTHISLGKHTVNNVGSIVQDSDGKIYATNNFHLYCVEKGAARAVRITKDSLEDVTTLYKPVKGDVLAYVAGKGLYSLKKDDWQKVTEAGESTKVKFFRSIYITHYGDTLLATGVGLYVVRNKKIVPQLDLGLPESINVYYITEDARRNLWLGTDNGAYRVSGDGVQHFNSKNGFTDNTVFMIFKDVENNLWFATDADGIFNFRENTFTYYDKSSGMANPIIMGIVEDSKGKIYLGGYGGGLYEMNEKQEIQPVNLPDPTIKESKITSLYSDNEDDIWIGTLGKGAWRYNEKSGLKKVEGKDGTFPRGGTCFYKDKRGNVLIGNAQGLFLYDKGGDISRIKMTAQLVSTLKPLNEDTIIAGTSNGLFYIDGNYKATQIGKKEFVNTSILCIDIKNHQVWMGTTDRGLLKWDTRSGKVYNYNTSSGLPSNFIYSLYVTGKGSVWTGTGFGISSLYLSDSGTVKAVKNYGRAEGLLGMECNHNAVLRASDSGLWFGTTKGLFHFNPNNAPEDKQPMVVLKSVKLFSSEITDSSLCKGFDNWFGVPQQLKLRSGQDHLTFEVGGIYLTNPDGLLYKYKLEGIDNDYITSANPVIVYASLPPGKYVLKVMAITKNGVASVNTIEYPFEIEKAFYQTRPFQGLVILLLISSGAAVVLITSWRRQKRKAVLEKIREEEFMKLRHRTAEDFHDEVGNKLTRISVLADILKAKSKTQEAETVRIVDQIKENTNALYAGSRDIIWSLNPQNDGIYEIAGHIRDIGTALFNDTAIDLELSHNLSAQKNKRLKLDYSRNLIMTFKEIYSNILKHASAKHIRVNFNLADDDRLFIEITDDGKGFDATLEQPGNGLKNIKNRVGRMNGTCSIVSATGAGTKIEITLNNIFT